MKFIVSSTHLLKQVNALVSIVPTNPVLPILENLLFELENGNLKVTANDLHVAMVVNVTVESSDFGSVAVPARIFSDTLKNLPEQPIVITVDTENYTLSIQSDYGRYKITCENPDDYPQLQEVTETQTSFQITSDHLVSAASYTTFAVSGDEMKPNMQGVFVHFVNDSITFAATDSHRLVRYRQNNSSANGITETMLIPEKALRQLQKTLPSDSTTVNVNFNQRNAFFEFGKYTLWCRLIDEKFPDYEVVMPKNNDKRMVVDRSAIIGSLKRLSIYTNKTTNQIRLSCKANQLVIKAEDMDFSNEADEALPCEYNDEEFTIGFGAKLLLEMLNGLNSERVVFEFSASSRPALLMPDENNADENVLMLLMPVLISY
ncbi:MAG: DNA polymerase III subunit beta [Cytophagales bacterium]|nr:MAG: DNA polymerase III subunit beta [Cytophagales bacterium]TAF61854.1 MAG: DNA polymerase III subunit beta [Cytophagales bacterium]